MGNSDQVNELYADVKEIKSFLLGDKWHEGFKAQSEQMRKTVYLQGERIREIERRGESCNLSDIETRVEKLEQSNKNRTIRNATIWTTLGTTATFVWQWTNITTFFGNLFGR